MIYERSHRTNGAPRVHAELAKTGWRCGRKRVARLMRSHHQVGAHTRRRWRTAWPEIITTAADLVRRNFDPFGPDVLWAADVTRIRTGEGWLYLPSSSTTTPAGWSGPHPGRDRATLRKFFDLLGSERCAAISHVPADQADRIAEIVAECCPNALQCADPFHVVKWATEALDEVRRQAWNDARRSGQTYGKGRGRRDAVGDARRLKNARYALWKNPDNLTERQRDKLAWTATTDPRHRAYLLKEGPRYVFAVKGEAGKAALVRWLSWARCRIDAFVDLARRITAVRTASTPPSSTA